MKYDKKIKMYIFEGRIYAVVSKIGHDDVVLCRNLGYSNPVTGKGKPSEEIEDFIQRVNDFKFPPPSR